tara:strand:- start:214 stop:612 length:399 start_codon:yes stop_codon:yes gene_type:complete
MSFENAIQVTIFTALDGVISVPVYDRVPQEDDASLGYPYVTIGEDIHTDWSTATESGVSVSIVIDTWSRAEGRKELKGIQGEIYDELHREELTVAGYHFVGCEFDNSTSFLDADGKTQHGVSIFRIIIDQIL